MSIELLVHKYRIHKNMKLSFTNFFNACCTLLKGIYLLERFCDFSNLKMGQKKYITYVIMLTWWDLWNFLYHFYVPINQITYLKLVPQFCPQSLLIHDIKYVKKVLLIINTIS